MEHYAPFAEDEIDLSKLDLKDNYNTAPSTLFPKITGRIKHLSYNYMVHTNRCLGLHATTPLTSPLPVLTMTGTVKLHGTHADLVIHSDNNFRIQSRNRLYLSKEADNYDVAARLLPLKSEILGLRDAFVARWKELNPQGKIEDGCPVIIAGEYIGPGVQKKVALADLKRRYFVILSASINNAWLPDEGCKDICAEDVGILNISRGGLFRQTVDLGDPGKGREAMNARTLEVEKECPFAKSLGVKGIGEGIVWKAALPLGADARFWLKTKGPEHRHSRVEKLEALGINGDALAKARQFAEAAVSERRCEQAWEYLEEMGLEKNKGNVKVVVEWMCKDVEVEERGGIEELGVDVKLLRKAVGACVRSWYFGKMGVR